MRLDVVSIFPDYLTPLELSLIGKARRRGLIDLRVHDLRSYTFDRHHTVDDTPYGGGAGMVMQPEPWGLALDALAAEAAEMASAPGSAPEGRPVEAPGQMPEKAPAPAPIGDRPVLVVPGPAGRPFTQALAEQLCRESWLVFACGRYEGIDERVYEYAAQDLGWPVEVISLGDYVLNGGEVAVLAMIEAIVRLVPGVVGNAESLVEESHSDGLLEHPVYTKPASWRGHDVPEVLLSGDHAQIAAWRRQRSRERTAARRPDLLPPMALASGADLAREDAALTGLKIQLAVPADAAELLVLQRCCWADAAPVQDLRAIPELTEGVEEVRAWVVDQRWWIVRDAVGRLVAAIRAAARPPDVWQIDRAMVVPDLRGRGIGGALLAHAEAAAPEGTTAFRLLVDAATTGPARLRRLRRLGYRPLRAAEVPDVPSASTAGSPRPTEPAQGRPGDTVDSPPAAEPDAPAEPMPAPVRATTSAALPLGKIRR